MALSRVKVWGNEILTPSDLNGEFNNIINNASSLISPLSGSLDWDGFAHVLDAVGVTTAQSTVSTAWLFTPGNKSGSPGTTGGISNWSASTWTDNNTGTSSTTATWTGISFQRPTLAASNASVTTTDAATVYIANSPLAGTNETITNPWSLWVDSGHVRFDNNIYWLSGTSSQGILAHANTGNRTYTFPDSDGNIPYIASQATVNAMVSTTTSISPNHNTIIMGTEVASTSGTAITFTGLPSGVRRLTINFIGVSTNGTDNLLIQLGASGGIETTGYLGAGGAIQDSAVSAVTTSTAGLLIRTNSAAGTLHGSAVFNLENATNFTWAGTVTAAWSQAALVFFSGSSKSLSSELTQVRITTVGGTQTFDAGLINISYER